MAYSDFSLPEAIRQFGLTTDESRDLFADVPEVTLSAFLVELLADNIHAGFGQCVAAMVAAQRFNARHQIPIVAIHGAITTGSLWQFLRLEESALAIDRSEYHITMPGKILGILRFMAVGPEAAPGV